MKLLLIINDFLNNLGWFEPYKEIRLWLKMAENHTDRLKLHISKSDNSELIELYELYYIQGLTNFKIADKLNVDNRRVNERKRELYAYIDSFRKTV